MIKIDSTRTACFKYGGSNKFSPKSFMSGSSVGHINLNAVSKDVLFAQIRMFRELMFSVDTTTWLEMVVQKCGPNGQHKQQYHGRKIWVALC